MHINKKFMAKRIIKKIRQLAVMVAWDAINESSKKKF